jgi:hypothetical protein
MEDASHDFVCKYEVVCVEGVYDALFGMAERTGVGYTTQHEETQMVRVDRC